jgi:hypothetical protein
VSRHSCWFKSAGASIQSLNLELLTPQQLSTRAAARDISNGSMIGASSMLTRGPASRNTCCQTAMMNSAKTHEQQKLAETGERLYKSSTQSCKGC